MSTDNEKIGKAIDAARKDRGVSLQQLGDAAGLTKSQVSRICAGKSAVQPESLHQFAERLDYPVWYLYMLAEGADQSLLALIPAIIDLEKRKKIRLSAVEFTLFAFVCLREFAHKPVTLSALDNLYQAWLARRDSKTK